MQIGKPQPNAASDHQIRSKAMDLAAGRAQAAGLLSMDEIIDDAEKITMFIKWGTTPAKNPHK